MTENLHQQDVKKRRYRHRREYLGQVPERQTSGCSIGAITIGPGTMLSEPAHRLPFDRASA